MASMTNALENELLDGLLGVTPFTTETTYYLALFTADPTETGSTADEVVGNGDYTRISLAGKFTASSGITGISANTAEIAFTQCAIAWGTITHIAVCRSNVIGTADLDLVGALILEIPTTIGYTFKFNIGDLTLTLA